MHFTINSIYFPSPVSAFLSYHRSLEGVYASHLFQIALGSDGLSCSSPSSAGTCIDTKGNPPKNFQSLAICSDATSSSPFRPQCDDVNPCLLSQGDSTHHSGCLQFGTCASGGTFLDL